MDGMEEWQSRPLDPIYPVVFVDAINVKVRNDQVANRPVYVALAVTVEGTREILGIWAGDGGEGAKHWLQVFTELKNRGVNDVLMLVCGGLNGLPDAVEAVWPRTIVQTCIVHLLRNSFRFASRADWDKMAKALRPAGLHRTERGGGHRAVLEFSEIWGAKYPAVIKLWSDAWAEFVPSWPSTWRSARSSARRTPSSPSTRASAGPSGPGDTSRIRRPKALDHALEGPVERLRHRLRRPHAHRHQVTIQQGRSAVKLALSRNRW